mmetsp:Transcript_42637/g.95728  ORF Transcript_42637/g.95728 Transcript_42637/m.95728 type:complete len:239 (-) Transcript_42637:382-1098(-)
MVKPRRRKRSCTSCATQFKGLYSAFNARANSEEGSQRQVDHKWPLCQAITLECEEVIKLSRKGTYKNTAFGGTSLFATGSANMTSAAILRTSASGCSQKGATTSETSSPTSGCTARAAAIRTSQLESLSRARTAARTFTLLMCGARHSTAARRTSALVSTSRCESTVQAAAATSASESDTRPASANIASRSILSTSWLTASTAATRTLGLASSRYKKRMSPTATRSHQFEVRTASVMA